MSFLLRQFEETVFLEYWKLFEVLVLSNESEIDQVFK